MWDQRQGKLSLEEVVWYIIEKQGQAQGCGTPLLPHWETTVAQQRPCSQSRVNNVRVSREKKGAKGRGRASVIDHGPWLEGTCWKSGGGATEERWGTSDLWTTAYSSTYSKPPSSNTSFEFDKVLCLLINTQQHARMVCYPSCNLKLKKEKNKNKIMIFC